VSVDKNTSSSSYFHDDDDAFLSSASFMKIHSMTSSCLFNRGTTFSQTVADKVFFATFPKMRTFQFHSRCRPNDPDRV